MSAESHAEAAQSALKKLEDQLTCAICLDVFKDPKLLRCFHVFCKDCIQRLVVQDHRQGQLFLCCPTCRQPTFLPPTASGVACLQSAFYIHHLFDIAKSLEKLKEPQNVQCEKCTKSSRTATNFCRECGQFICEKCFEMHSEWKEFAKHEVVSIEKIHSDMKQLVPPKNVVLYCSQHQGKELDLYCETCEELICLHCTVKIHKHHQYDLVADNFERHREEINKSVEPIERDLSVTTKVKEQLELLMQQLDDQRDSVKAEIQQQIQQLEKVLEQRKIELFNQVDQFVAVKKKKLEAQKEAVETIEAQRMSCLSFIKESLKTGSQGEVMKVKKTILKQVKEMRDYNFESDTLQPCEHANVKFTASSELESACKLFGEVYLQEASPKNCYATGKDLHVAEPGERAVAALHIVNENFKACMTPVNTVTCELESINSVETVKCTVKKTDVSQYEISYEPTTRGKHQLHIKVEGEHIKGSPFPVTVKLPVKKLGTPIRSLGNVRGPLSVALSKSGNLIVSQFGGDRVSIFNREGEYLKSFGSSGKFYGQFSKPEGVAVDANDNILVADYKNHRIQMFTPDGHFITAVGKHGDKHLEFRNPCSIGVHPCTRKIYVVDSCNRRIQILNNDLTFSSIFGDKSKGDGQLNRPSDVAFDSFGNVYIADSLNHFVQVFTAEGKYLRKIGRSGKEVDRPTGIAIDNDDVVYVTDSNNHRVSVFSFEGTFLTSFGTEGSGLGQFNGPFGIAVDKDGGVYVADCFNDRILFF